MRRPARHTLLAAAICALFAIAAAPSGSGAVTVVAEDPCGAVSLPETPMPAWLDLCAVTFRTVAAGDGVSTVLDIEVRVAGDIEVRSPSTFEVRWSTVGCRATLVSRDARPGDGSGVSAPARSALLSDCSDIGDGRDCTYETDSAGISCRFGASAVDVPPPTFSGDTVTWTLTVAGEVAEHVGAHGPGTVLDRVHVTSQDAVTQQNIALVCGEGTNDDCTDSIGDRMRGERPHVVRSE